MNSKDKKTSMVSLVELLSKNDIIRKTHYEIPSYGKSGGGKKFILYSKKTVGLSPQENLEQVITCLKKHNIGFTPIGKTGTNCTIIASTIPDFVSNITKSGVSPTENQSEASGQSSSDIDFQNFVNDNDEMNQEIKNQELSKIINLHRDMGILGTLNREQEYSKINLFHFNYFNKDEMEHALKFFTPLGCVSIRTGKRCNLEFDLTKFSESKIMELGSFKILDITILDTNTEPTKIQVLAWIVKKVFRESVSVLSNTQFPYTTQRIELAARNFESNASFLKKIGFCFFTEYVNITKKSIFVSLNEDFDQFLKTDTSTETTFINFISAYKPGVAKPEKQISMNQETNQTKKTPLSILRTRLYAYQHQHPQTKKGFNLSEKSSSIATIKFSSKELFKYAKKTISETDQPKTNTKLVGYAVVVSEKEMTMKVSYSWDQKLTTDDVKTVEKNDTEKLQRKKTGALALDGATLLGFLEKLEKRGFKIVSAKSNVEVTSVVVKTAMGDLKFGKESIKSIETNLVEISPKDLLGL